MSPRRPQERRSSRLPTANGDYPKQAAVDGPTSVAPPPDVSDVSRYLADICGELASMAGSARLAMLSYLLGMAHQEAGRLVRKTGKAN